MVTWKMEISTATNVAKCWSAKESPSLINKASEFPFWLTIQCSACLLITIYLLASISVSLFGWLRPFVINCLLADAARIAMIF